MSKGRNPRKRRDDGEKEIEREPEPAGQALLPPAPAAVQAPSQPALAQVVQAVRFAAAAERDARAPRFRGAATRARAGGASRRAPALSSDWALLCSSQFSIFRWSSRTSVSEVAI